MIPYDSPPCYHSSMRHLVVLFIHLIAVLTHLLQPVPVLFRVTTGHVTLLRAKRPADAPSMFIFSMSLFQRHSRRIAFSVGTAG
jgi:hypothetical protein